MSMTTFFATESKKSRPPGRVQGRAREGCAAKGSFPMGFLLQNGLFGLRNAELALQEPVFALQNGVLESLVQVWKLLFVVFELLFGLLEEPCGVLESLVGVLEGLFASGKLPDGKNELLWPEQEGISTGELTKPKRGHGVL